jgi:hypothetical protein
MNARVDLPEAHEVCPTTTRRLLAEGAPAAFDVPGVMLTPRS